MMMAGVADGVADGMMMAGVEGYMYMWETEWALPPYNHYNTENMSSIVLSVTTLSANYWLL